MIFASKELAITSSSYFSGNLFSRDSTRVVSLLVLGGCKPHNTGQIADPSRNHWKYQQLKKQTRNKPPNPQTSFPETGEKLLPGQHAGLRTISHPTAGMLINFTINELVRTYLPDWRFQGRYSFDARCHLPQWADRISPKPHALVLLCY